MADAQDRRLPASERKIRKARAEGQVARSRDLAHSAAIGTSLALLALAPGLLEGTARTLALALSFDAAAVLDPQAMLERLSTLAAAGLRVALVVGLLLALAAVAAGVLGGGWNFTLQALAPRLDKLDPVGGFARLASAHQLVDTLKACALALVLGTIGALYLRARLPQFTAALALPLPAALAQAGDAVTGGLWLLLLALAAFAAVDVPLQRHQLAQRLRMTPQEFKQEQREVEGSAEIKSRQRSRMRELATRRMLAAVPKADLVVMNPSHYAVALKYDESRMSAPTVVAKGADLVALRIRDAAVGAQVPVLRAPPLARALYAHVDLDAAVPATLFAAVAQVLAHVYQLRAHLAGHGAAPAPLPDLPVPPELDPHHGRTEDEA